MGNHVEAEQLYRHAIQVCEKIGDQYNEGINLVNLAGCFLMALLVEAAFRGAWPETVRLAVTAGYLGGLTTYSSFNFETTRLLETGASGAAGAYLLATLVGAFIAGRAGLALGRHLFAA